MKVKIVKESAFGRKLEYCPICESKLRYDKEGNHFCPTCKRDVVEIVKKAKIRR